MRVCKKCGEEKDGKDFYEHSYGVRYECKDCHNIRNLLRLYNLPRNSYDRLVESQDSKCALCLRKRAGRLCVDHNHQTGEIRGLLCKLCNTYLGVIERDPSILERIRRYL